MYSKITLSTFLAEEKLSPEENVYARLLADR
jgi:hypothetical protein